MTMQSDHHNHFINNKTERHIPIQNYKKKSTYMK